MDNKKIDGYRIYGNEEEKRKKTKTDKREITIAFFSDGKEVIPPKTYQIDSLDNIEKIREILFQYTMNNLNEEDISKCIPASQIIKEVEQIVYNDTATDG